jgi:hypothetical protein
LVKINIGTIAGKGGAMQRKTVGARETRGAIQTEDTPSFFFPLSLSSFSSGRCRWRRKKKEKEERRKSTDAWPHFESHPETRKISRNDATGATGQAIDGTRAGVAQVAKPARGRGVFL